MEAVTAKQFEAELSRQVLKELEGPVPARHAGKGVKIISSEHIVQVVGASAKAKASAAKPALPKTGSLRASRRALSEKDLASFYKVRVHRAVRAAFQNSVGAEDDFVIVSVSGTQHQAILRAVVKGLPEVVERRQANQLEKHIESLVDVYLPKDPLASAYAELANDNAKARAELLAEMPMLQAAEIASLAGHDARNRSVTASRWKKTGQIFAVRHNGTDLYPAFQFRDQQPHPTIAKVLAVLPEAMSGWKIAFWFAGANGWLAGARPMDRLDATDQIVSAAQHEGEAWAG